MMLAQTDASGARALLARACAHSARPPGSRAWLRCAKSDAALSNHRTDGAITKASPQVHGLQPPETPGLNCLFQSPPGSNRDECWIEEPDRHCAWRPPSARAPWRWRRLLRWRPRRQAKYVAGDFHNHTTCSDGSISMQKLVKKATGQGRHAVGPRLVRAGRPRWQRQPQLHAGGRRDPRDARLSARLCNGRHDDPRPTTSWQNTNPPQPVKGAVNGTAPNQNMWRWQSLQEYQYPLVEYLSAPARTSRCSSACEIRRRRSRAHLDVRDRRPDAGQDFHREAADRPGLQRRWVTRMRSRSGRTASIAATPTRAVATRPSAAATATTGTARSPGSANDADPSWNAAAQKLLPASGAGVGTKGHLKTVEAMKWMAQKYPAGSYYVPAHLERAGPFNPDGNNGFNIEHLRDFNNAAPDGCVRHGNPAGSRRFRCARRVHRPS